MFTLHFLCPWHSIRLYSSGISCSDKHARRHRRGDRIPRHPITLAHVLLQGLPHEEERCRGIFRPPLNFHLHVDSFRRYGGRMLGGNGRSVYRWILIRWMHMQASNFASFFFLVLRNDERFVGTVVGLLVMNCCLL